MADTQLCVGCGEKPAVPKSGMNAKIGGSHHRTCESCRCASQRFCFVDGRVMTRYPKIQGSSWCASCTKKEIKRLKVKVDHLEKKIQKAISRGACPDRFVEDCDEKTKQIVSLQLALSDS